jgi:hypothetical protein
MNCFKKKSELEIEYFSFTYLGILGAKGLASSRVSLYLNLVLQNVSSTKLSRVQIIGIVILMIL